MKTLLQPTMSMTADAAGHEGFAGTNGTPTPETEVGAELQARLADTEARLADALNRLAFREAEIAAFAPEGAAAPPRRAVLMARVAQLEQASESQESELQDLRSIAKARDAELGKTKAKLKELEKSAKLHEAELGKARAKLKLREVELVQARGKLKARDPERAQAKNKPKTLEKSARLRETQLRQAKAKPQALEAALEQVRSTEVWKVAGRSVLAATKSLGIASKWRKGRIERENLRRHIELLAASELFDGNWYLAAYPDVAASGIDPAQHYLRYGADEGRDPGPRFSTRKYLERHSDVAEARMNPLLHYLKFGLEERRAIFGAQRRGAERGQAKARLKAREPERGPPVRSTRLWKIVGKSVLAAGKSLGIARKGATKRENLRRHIELLATSELFDGNWYLAAYPDVAASGINPAQHYLRYGADEGRDPGPRFSTRKYLNRYPDVARAGMNPLVHYLEFGLDEQRTIFAANRNVAVAAASAVKRPKRPAREAEPALVAATVFSLPPVHREEAAWIRHEALSRREGRATLELHGTILGFLPPSAQMVGTDSLASLPLVRAATVFCQMMRLGDAEALRCFEADAEFALPPADLPGAPLGRHFLSNVGPVDVADAWFASARDLRLRFAKPTPVLRFFQWDRHAGKVVLLSEAPVRASSGLADVPTVNPLLPILVAASDAEGVLEGLFLLPFPSLCRGGCHYGELLSGQGGSVMERLLALSTALAEAWLTGDRGPYTIGRIDVDLANARGSEIIFSRAMQLWLDSCFDVRCRPINGSAIADERVRLYLEERLRGEEGEAEGLSERERSASYALQLGAGAIPSLQAMVARGAPAVGSAGLGASILIDGATGKARWLLDLARLDAGLLENHGTDGAPSPKVIPLREQASHAEQPATSHAAHGVALALSTTCDDSAARVELLRPVTRLTKSGGAVRNPSAPPEISVLCPYWGDERRFAAFLDSMRLQTNVTNLEVIVTAASGRAEAGASLENLVRRFFPDGQVITCDDETLPGTRLNLMAERARCDLLLVAAGVLLHDPSTLDALRHIARETKAATVGCVLRGVAGRAGLAHLHCAGFCPDGKEEPRGVVATFARIDSAAPLGSWTYPIAANPPPLFMTRKTTWRKLGGFNENVPELATVAIDFAVRGTAHGDLHLCTSALSATVIDAAIADTPRTISLPSATPPLAWRDAAARSVVVRTLVT